MILHSPMTICIEYNSTTQKQCIFSSVPCDSSTNVTLHGYKNRNDYVPERNSTRALDGHTFRVLQYRVARAELDR